MVKRRLLAVLLALSVSLSMFSTALAQEAPSYPVPLYDISQFFGLPEAGLFTISADGESLLFLAQTDGILNIFRRDITTGEEEQLTFADSSITNYFVSGNTVLFLQDHQGDEIFQLHRVNGDGTVTNLVPDPGVITMVLDLMEDVEDEILILMNREDPTVFALYRIDVITGEVVRVLDWFAAGLSVVMDSAGVIRVVTIAEDLTVTVMHRYNYEDEFDLVGVYHVDEFVLMVQFDDDDEYVFAISNVGRDTDAIVRVNPATAEEVEVLYIREGIDVQSFSVSDNQLAMVIYNAEFEPVRTLFTEELSDFFDEIAQFFDPNYWISPTSISDDERIVIVSTSSDVSRGGVYLVNLDEGTAEQLIDRNEGINPAHMAPMLPIEYIARDGLRITGYLTLPVGVEPVNLPLVVNPHGGPWVRDAWGWRSEVQFLANRGYAVFQPNFRGSAGFGREFLQASFGEWGLAMQDDVTDGVLYLIDSGIVDPNRIAIYGASYGGFSALAGAAFTPELYAAVISYVPVSSLFTFIESIPPWWESQRELLYHRIGHPVYDYDRLRATSPLYHVDNIIAPLFLAHGANDPRTVLQETINIVDAMNERGVEVELFIAWDEGHGFMNFHNNYIFYSIMEAFLAEHIGGRTLTRMDELERPFFDTAPLELMQAAAEAAADLYVEVPTFPEAEDIYVELPTLLVDETNETPTVCYYILPIEETDNEISAELPTYVPPQIVPTYETEQAGTAADTGTIVNAQAVNVRASGSVNADVVGVVRAGDEVTILETTGVSFVWHRIQAGDLTGWIYSGFLQRN